MSGWILVIYIVGMFTLLGVAHWRRSRRNQPFDPNTGMLLPIPKLRRPERALVLAVVSCYALYGVLMVLSGIACFVWMATTRTLLAGSRWEDLLFFIIMFMIWVSIIILLTSAEIYLRRGIEHHQLLRRFVLIFVILSIFTGLGLALQRI